ncbi:MAG: helix-turn-helix domain-containing protein [Paraburkholderia sp.]|nr:helix-turn-helix domain-containing protein [Paraburkholderia sp.]
MTKNQSYGALVDAVRVAGTQERVAAMAGKRQGHFSKWLRSPLGVPAEHCMAIEEGCLAIDPGCNVTCERLRPDLLKRWTYMRASAKRFVDEPIATTEVAS